MAIQIIGGGGDKGKKKHETEPVLVGTQGHLITIQAGGGPRVGIQAGDALKLSHSILSRALILLFADPDAADPGEKPPGPTLTKPESGV